MSVISHKCPNCGSAVNYDAKTGSVRCVSCNSEFTNEEMKQYQDKIKSESTTDEDEEMDPEQVKVATLAKIEEIEETQKGVEWDGDAGYTEDVDGGVVEYRCPSCGGGIIADHSVSATKCPYCDNPALLTENLSGMLKPEIVIPFKIPREEVKKALYKFYKKKILLPKKFKEENHIEDVAGIYVPFWLYDADINAKYMFEATRVRSWSDGSYDYTETSYYDVYRDADMSFSQIPVDGSEKMDDNMMDSIEPFDYADNTDFDGMYVAGFMAEKYTVDHKEAAPRANLRIENSAEDFCRETAYGYDGVLAKSGGVTKTSEGSVKYALLPVWQLHTKYKDKTYVFAMNGQTGKFVGKLPIDKVKLAMWTVGSALFALGVTILLDFWGNM